MNKLTKLSKLRVGIILVALAVIGIGIFTVAKLFTNSTDVVDSLAEERINKAVAGETDNPNKSLETLNVLLMGLDGESKNEDIQNQEARADTMMVVSINPKTNTTKVVSLPRDTYVFDSNVQDFIKLNATYIYGGPEGSVRAVEELLHIPIDFYVTVNMTGLESLVDAIGGVEVTPPLTFSYHDTYFEEGVARHVNGVEAMNYVRMRKEDPRGDFGRQDRQQEVIQAILTKLLAMDARDYVKLVPFLIQHVRTNVNLTKGYALYYDYREAVKQLQRISLEDGVEDIIYNNQYFAYLLPDAQLRVVNDLREHSGLKPFIILNSPDKPYQEEATVELQEEEEPVVYKVPATPEAEPELKPQTQVDEQTNNSSSQPVLPKEESTQVEQPVEQPVDQSKESKQQEEVKPVTDTTVQSEPVQESELEPVQESIPEPIQEPVIRPEQELLTESSVLESITE